MPLSNHDTIRQSESTILLSMRVLTRFGAYTYLYAKRETLQRLSVFPAMHRSRTRSVLETNKNNKYVR